MFPILYENITAGQVPQHHGLGVLSDAISVLIEQERNGAYQLEMEYPMSGIHAQELTYRRIIKAKPNFTDDPQLFRIDRIGKEMNGVFTVFAKHISYDLSGYEITSGTAETAVLACQLLQNAATGYSITTDKTVSGNFKIYEPSSVRSWFGGKSGSFLDVFGTAELKYNNFNIQFLLHAGQDRGQTIRYGKNMLELSQEITDTLYTHVRAYWKNEDVVVLGSKISTGLTLDVPKEFILDCSSDYDEQPTPAELDNKATNYISTHNLTTPSNNIKLDFVQSGDLAGRVDLCDTVSIYYEALGITRSQVKCIRTVWDCLNEKYIETEFGDARTNLADTMAAQTQAIAEKPSKTFLAEAVDRATKLITGNLGGYVILHDSNGDGEPDEILIMDTPDITTAQKLWRWNQNGLGYSSSGYSGEFGLAATSQGEIVADFITVGSLSGNRVRTGAIISQNGQLIMDLDNGTITAPAITLSGQDVGSTLDSLVQTSVETRYALSNSGTVIPSAWPLTDPTTPTEQQPYLWSRTVYTYANGQTSTSYGVSVKGANGQNGADGAGLAILGNYDTMADLIADHPTGTAGEAYMVGTDLVVWNTNTNSWQNVGRIQGPSGFDGLWLAIENDDDGTSMNVTYTVRLLKGVTDVTTTYNAVFVWQLVKESGITEIATGTDTITVARDSADYGATIRCICIAIITEENLEDYTYTVIQDYSGNDIQIIGSNVVKLIGESEIYKPYAISSQFQVLSDEISSRVTQTEFNSLSGTVTTQGTLIQQNADAITLKADTTTVNAGLNGKMGTDMSNRASSIRIDSGQIRFDSNSLVVNSSQFTLDAQGNATFGGNITAASINIGGEYVGLGTAIDNAEADAISAAATDATNKANAAANNAISTASTDATNKANNAKNSAISSANSYTDTGLAGKVGNNEVRTKFAADTHSVTIQSGTVRFKSNTLLVDSTQFTLDASGNATFKGNLSAATIVIGGTTTNIGTAINNAESDAISTAAADATTKANNAKSSAISTAAADATTKANNAKNTAITTAAADATTKANNAQSNAITAAASDATTKANNALASSKTYTDTGLAGKVGNNEIRTKFAADTHSVTIESGTIAFTSNTLSIDSDNLKVTNTGQVIANYFRAKNTFRVINSSDVVLASIEPATNGGLMAVGRPNGTQVGTLWATADGGLLSLANGSGTQQISLSGATGNIIASGAINATGAIVCGGLTAKTQIVAADTSSVTRVFFNAGTYGYGALRNSSGNNNIYFYGNTGDIEIAGRIIQNSSRKVKKNIKPIEDAEKILELQAVSFDYIDEEIGTDRRGFIAEDVYEVLPNLVTPETEERNSSLDYVGMIPYLQAVIKDQEQRIKALEEKLDILMKKES